MSTNHNRNLEVVLRLRPFLRRELKQKRRKIIQVIDENSIIFDPFHEETTTESEDNEVAQYYERCARKNVKMSFDKVFDSEAKNIDVYQYALHPLVSTVLKGYNCSAFVYGVTGAGKTYTMLGNDHNPGVTYSTMKELFKQIQSLRHDQDFDIRISYVEVYNEQVMNLLTRTGPLKLRENASGVIIDGVIPQPISSCDEVISLLSMGNHNRAQHPTDANYNSSRSHAIFQVHICMTNKATDLSRMVKLSMIDLAGSERGSSANPEDQRFKEGTCINKSLLALGNCIKKLADGSKHIPYRDSNVTRILKDSLGGNCRTVMIANVSPSERSYNETYNTLIYATRARQIRTQALTKSVLKTNLPKEYYVHNLAVKISETEQLQERIKSLENQVESQAKVIENFENAQNGLVKLVKKIETLKHKIDKSYHDLLTNRVKK